MENALSMSLYKYMEGAGVDWAVCGGHAIDLFIGRQTRDHQDVDVAVFWDQRERLLNYLLTGGFRIFEPENGLLREVTGAEDNFRRNDNLWCIAGDSPAYKIERDHANFYRITTRRRHQDTLDFIEFLFNRRNGDQFIYKRDKSITHESAILRSGAGMPYLAPELVLLYKSVFIRSAESRDPADIDRVSRCRHDFAAAAPLLDERRKCWLEHALRISYPNGHEWLDVLREHS